MSEEINEANGNIREIHRLRGLLAQAQTAADQAINNLRTIVALNDDPHIEAIANATADLLAGVLPNA